MSIGLAHMSCRELVELVTAYLEDALPPADRMRFDAHLAQCDGCTTYLDQMRGAIALTGTLRLADVSPEAERLFLQTFRDWHAGS